MDYGVHIFEDPATHMLVGATPAGVYHIEWCDLNADHLVLGRRRRSELCVFMAGTPVVAAKNIQEAEALRAIETLKSMYDEMIPPIPAPPDPSLSARAEAQTPPV
jgi:hypothetical protein